MEAEAQALTVTRSEFGPEAGACFSKARINTGDADLLANIKRAAADGGLFRVADSGGRLVGYYALEIDGNEGLLLAAAGHAESVDLTAVLLPHIEGQFKQIGLSSMRFHTRRPGLVRRAVLAGFVPEMVLRKRL